MASNANENPDSDAEQADLESSTDAETVETEVVENRPEVSEQVEALSTFSESRGPLELKVMPNVERGGTEWRIVVYSDGVRGPLLETNRELTDAQAAELGISSELQNRLNEALEYAQAELELPRELGHMSRAKQSLSDLEALME